MAVLYRRQQLITHGVVAGATMLLTWGFLDARLAAEVGEIRVDQADAQLAAVQKARTEERAINKTY